LTPFQLVVVGSAMEAAVFVSEIPTGVVADLYSRRWSVIIGHAGIGLAFVAEASLPSFGGILFAQVLWGVAYTFTSGATEAWLAGEMGEPSESELRRVLFRASRWSTIVVVVMLPTSFLLGAVSLRLPIAIAAGVQFVIVGWLVVGMREDHFERAAPDERSDWRRFRATTGDGVRALRRNRTLALLAAVIVVAGGSSEAYDRYGERHLLRDVGVPTIAGHGPLVTLSVVFTSSSLCGVFIAWWMEHHVDRRGPGVRRWLVWLVLVQAVGLVAFALTGSFVVAALSVIVIDRVRRVREKLFSSWIIPLTPKANRATVLSTFSQCDAVGQVTVGLAMGVIGGVWSVSAALVASAVVLAPTAWMVVAARRSDEGPLLDMPPRALP
jgi:DHA3 family tetracycline resistance protein-like MFS transporter